MHPSGHFYSPIPSKKDLIKYKDRIWKNPSIDLKGIDLREKSQFKLLRSIIPYFDLVHYDGEYTSTKYRYKKENNWFPLSDAFLLFGIIARYRPRRIVEIGSGFSSACMLDSKDILDLTEFNCDFIEPNSERLKDLLLKDDVFNLIEKPVQEIELDFFERLEENDILFIDSSHISKVGSDVNYLIFEVLPTLNKGVLVHFHDIFYPFEYPEQWVMLKDRFWNENYLLRAFLSYNYCFEILLFNSFLSRVHSNWLKKNLPLFVEFPGGSIWIKVKKRN